MYNEFDTAMAKAWKDDEDNILDYHTPVRIDLTWFYDTYGKYPDGDGAGHGKYGTVCNVWRDVDGFFLYEVELEEGGVYGAYSRRDLVVV